jgi:hypothetical protein
MKTNKLYALSAVAEDGVSLYTKLFLAFAILAILFTSLPVASALAAPTSVIETDDLTHEWKNKLRTLRYQGFYYDTVRLLPADFRKQADLDLANMYLEKYGFALRQANTVVFNHTGFDINGRVLNEKQAVESLEDLSMYIHAMRGLRGKIEDIEDLQD